MQRDLQRFLNQKNFKQTIRNQVACFASIISIFIFDTKTKLFKYYEYEKWYSPFLNFSSSFIPLSANTKKWSNTLKKFVGCCWRIFWMGWTFLWGWRLKNEPLGRSLKIVSLSIIIKKLSRSSEIFWRIFNF